MAEAYMFIDESGNLGSDGTRYFVIAAIWTKMPKVLDRLIKNLRRNKFRKELKTAQELKANSSSNELREWLLKKLNLIEDIKCHAIILDKEKVFSAYLKNNRHKLYNYVCGVLAGSVGIDTEKLIVRIDASKGKQALKDDFNRYLKEIWTKRFWNRPIEFYHSWSHSWSGLQIADFVAWCVFQKFERGNDFYAKIIEKKLGITHVWE